MSTMMFITVFTSGALFGIAAAIAGIYYAANYVK